VKIAAHTTHRERKGGWQEVRYYKTVIASWNDETVELSLGEWDTVSTRRRLNLVSSMFNLGFTISRRRGRTWIEYEGEEWFFHCETRLDRTGKKRTHRRPSKADKARERELDREAKRLWKEFKATAHEDELAVAGIVQQKIEELEDIPF
jgi:hypothetical protein